MKSIRLIFFFLVLAISSIIVLLSTQSPPDQKKTEANRPSYFIGAFGKGRLFKDATRQNPYITQKESFTDEKALIYTEHDSSAAFLFSGHRLLILGNSGIEINPKLNKFIAIEGTLVWHRVLRKDSEILIGSPNISFNLSDSGILFTQGENTTITNFSATTVLSTPTQTYSIENQTHYLFKDGMLIDSNPIPAKISDIDPYLEKIAIRAPKDSLLRFNWKTVPGISEYRFRLFGSSGMSPLLLERIVASDRLIVDLLHYENTDLFYWDVTPYYSAKNIFGIPSKLGFIEKSGRIMEKASALLPPTIEIKALTVSGSMVLIEGVAQPDSDLYIDEIPVKKDDEGRFIHTLSYKKMGQKTILFRLVSPAEIETRLERTVTVFAE